MNEMEPIRDLQLIDEIKRHFKQKNERDYMLFVVGINVALRISDLRCLKVGHIRGQTKLSIMEKKNKNARLQALSPELIKMVEEYAENNELSDDDYLFKSRQGKNQPIVRQRAHQILKEAEAEFGLRGFSTHSLRKTFGYHHYRRFKDVVVLQQLFGHSSQRETLCYIGVAQDEIDATTRNFIL